MNLYDNLDKATRTMLTSEATSNRSTHIIETKQGAMFFSPIECEHLNGFDDNWTSGMPNRAWYFTMVVVLIVEVVIHWVIFIKIQYGKSKSVSKSLVYYLLKKPRNGFTKETADNFWKLLKMFLKE